jgi:hypothetical protein
LKYEVLPQDRLRASRKPKREKLTAKAKSELHALLTETEMDRHISNKIKEIDDTLKEENARKEDAVLPFDLDASPEAPPQERVYEVALNADRDQHTSIRKAIQFEMERLGNKNINHIQDE